MVKESDQWETPLELFETLKKDFDIKIDLCATESNAKAEFLGDIFTLPDDVLQTRVAFMNPPYSNPGPYILKAMKLATTGKVIMLLKLDPSTKWWGYFYDKDLDTPRPGVQVYYTTYTPKRVRFHRAGRTAFTASFPSVVVGVYLPGETGGGFL